MRLGPSARQLTAELQSRGPSPLSPPCCPVLPSQGHSDPVPVLPLLGPSYLTPRPMRPLLKGSPMRVKAASWMKYGFRMRISGGSLGTRVATDFQKPSDALCGHSINGHELGTQRVMGLCEWQGPKACTGK